jgi:hypothetical protein
MNAAKYPAGVALIAVAQFVAAAELLGVAPFSESINGILFRLTGVSEDLGLGQGPGISTGSLILLTSPLWAAFLGGGVGLLYRKPWSWKLSLTLLKFWGSGNLIWLIFYAGMAVKFHTLPGFGKISAAPCFINAVMAGLSIWYLQRAEVKDALGQ